MESSLTDLGKSFVEKMINGAIAELRHVFCFTCIVKEFEEEKISLKEEMKTLEQRAKVAAGRDKDILANVHYWKEEVDKLIQEDIKIKQTCFLGLCPDCMWRYKRGKELANNIEEIKHLIKKGEKFENIERFQSKDYISFKSRECKYRELMDALLDENNYMIGLQGIGGIGKTTLAKKVGKELKISKQFTRVIITTVSFTPDTKKIQDDIVGPFGLELENYNDSNRPEEVWRILTSGEKILIIMDDVWDQDPPLDFDLIGIPKKDSHYGCRVLITTRSKQVLQKMNCDKKIELELLSEEEAWDMFKAYAGISNSFSKKLITKGREIAKECKQLPIAIVVIAGNLKGQQDRKHQWDATLKSLKKTVSMDDVDKEKVEIYKCLKSSYDGMKDEKVKGLFLLSSLFPEDKEISIEILTRLGIGTGLFGKNYGRYNDARNKVGVAIYKLIDLCLMVGVGEEHVKMHDLVREAAQWTAYKEIRCVKLSSKDEKSSVEKEKNMKYLFCEGKYMDLFSWKYDGSKLETLILDVKRDEDRKRMEARSSFFKNIDQLQVLYFSSHNKRPLSLPDSIHSLANIRSILVDGVDLGDISVLGNLQSLETLDLVNCGINELPHEISKLGKFKVLNLKDCEIRKNNPFEVIKVCLTLEELYFIDSFNRSCDEINLPQLQRYRVGNKWDWSRISYSLSKCVAFTDKFSFPSKATYKYCMQTSESLQLNGISIMEGWINLMPEIVDIHHGMNDLVELCLTEFSQLQCLTDTIGFQVPPVLSNLFVLKLEKMNNLEILFKGSLSFESLKCLEELSITNCKMLQRLSDSLLNLYNLKTIVLRKCPMLVNLSSLLTSRNLTVLERLEIFDCGNLKNIIIDERGEKELRETYNKKYVSMFPKLKHLEILNCQLLESVLPLLFSQDLPVLEDLRIENCDELKYIFRKCQHVELGLLKHIQLWQFPKLKTLRVQNCEQLEYIFEHYIDDHQNHNGIHLNLPALQHDHQNHNEIHLDLPALRYLELRYLKKLVSICPKHYYTTIPQLKILDLEECSLDNSIMKLLYTWQRAQYLPLQSNIMCNVTSITLYGISKIKSMFLLFNTSRMLVEYLAIVNCDELKHIIVDIGDDDDDNVSNNLVNVFPKLQYFRVVNCGELKHIFGHYSDGHQNKNEIHLQFPALEYLQLYNLRSFVAMCPTQYHTTFPPSIDFEGSSLDDAFLKCLKETNDQSIQYLKNWRASHVGDNNYNSSYKDLHEVEQTACNGKRQVQVQSKKESTSHKMEEALLAWTKASLAKVERYRDMSLESTSRVTSECSLTKCVTVLDEMRDIPQDAYAKALEKLMNPDWREVFIAMSIERKRGWVLGLKG